MIDAKEIRVGNWFLNGGYNYQYTEDRMPIIWYDLERLSPILLSPELLIKCGFKNDFSTFEYADGYNNGKLFITDIDGDLVVELGNGNKNIPIKLKYLHKLQNVYFNLFGEELEVNL